MDLRLRIGIVCLHTSPLAAPGAADAGGMNVVVLAQAKALAAMGHAVEIFTRRSDPHAHSGPVDGADETASAWRPGGSLTVTYLPAGPPTSLAKSAIDQHIAEFSAALRAAVTDRRAAGRGFHVLHSHHWMSGIAALDIAGDLRIPHVQSFHSIAALDPGPHDVVDLAEGEPAESVARVPGEARCAQESDLIIAISRAEAATAISRCGAHPSQVRVVLPGVDHDTFYPCAEATERARAEFERPYLFVAARLQPLKGIDLAIETLAAMPADEGPDLVIAGAASQDFRDYTDHVHKLVTGHGLTDRVHFLGAVDRPRLAELLHGAILTLVPSYSETYGLIALEAQACCCPVVAMATGGLTEAVRDQVTGILMGTRNPQRWADAVYGLLTDSDTLAQMGSEACRHAAARTWEHSATEIAGYYSSAIDPRRWLPGGDGPVVFFHAHPDDETIDTGALIRHLVCSGIEVHLVTATRGERGTVVPGPLEALTGTPELEVHRRGELAAATEVLGITQHCFLGEPPARAADTQPGRYVDSGMRWITAKLAGPATDVTDDALCSVPTDVAAADLAAYLDDVGARALISYDVFGTYGHPDHMRCHDIATQASRSTSTPFLEILSPAENQDVAAAHGIRGDNTESMVLDLLLTEYELTMRRALAQYASQLTVHGDTITHSGGETEPIRLRTGLRLSMTRQVVS